MSEMRKKKARIALSLVHSYFLPYVDIYLEVEEHEEHEGEDADGDEAEPVEGDRVGRVLSELGHVEIGSEMGGE